MNIIKKIKITGFLTTLTLSSLFIYQYNDESQNIEQLIESINTDILMNPTASGKNDFILLDATRFTNLMYPWIGFPVKIISEQDIFGSSGDYSDIEPNELSVKEALLSFKNDKRIIFNITSWKITADKENSLNELHIQWHLKLISWAKEILPATNIGFLNIPYSPWLALKSTQRNMLDYQAITKSLQPIIQASDSLYPLFQVMNPEENDLAYLMGAQLYIAKTFGKPVYPVISHKNTLAGEAFNTAIAPEILQQQCRFIHQNADGMVWWLNEPQAWDNAWYQKVSKQCFL